MNQKLQQLLDSIQQSPHLSDDEKAALTKTAKEVDKEIEITTFKLDRTEKVKKTTAILLEETIEELEQKRKAVEAQNRELEIEKSLEKVRSSALSMKKPSDMLEVCRIISEQLELLNVKEIRNVQTAIFYEDRGTYMNYEYYAKHKKTFITEVDYTNHEIAKAFAGKMLGGKGETFVTNIQGEEKVKEWITYQKTTNVFIDTFLETATSLNYYWFSLGPVALGISTYVALDDKELGLFKRFLNVFELAYRRYLDIEKAEAQAKEAQIEAALERVRSRTMGMQKSEELKEVIQIVYEQFVYLNINTEHAGFVMDYKVRDDHFIWVASKYGVPSQLTIPHFDCEYYNRFKEAKEKGWDFFAANLSFEEKNSFYRQLFTYIAGLPEEAKEFYFSCPGLAISTVLLENVGLYIENFEGIPYSQEDNGILMRFGKVFQQTYTRFLDLQKAEAQAKEAQIEVALERVRASTMAMQRSTDLADASRVLFLQMNALVPNLWSCGFVLCDKNNTTDEWYLSGGNGYMPDLILPNVGDRTHHNIYQLWLKGASYHEEIVEREELQKHYEWLMTIPVAKAVFDAQAAAGIARPVWQQLSCAYFTQGYLVLITEVSIHEEEILKRFAKVFEQTYTRFLDLQKAEAQAREAQIEVALERVRAKAMAMHKSDDLHEAVAVVFQELEKLNLGVLRVGISVLDKEKRTGDVWLTSVDTDKAVQVFGNESFDFHPLMQGSMDAWIRQEDFYYTLEGEDLTNYYKGVEAAQFGLPASQVLSSNHDYKKQSFYVAVYNAGGLFAFREEEFTPEAKAVMKRFANVFDLTYKRFLDLQKAEAQAREARIEASLERVRARTMAMQNSKELGDLVAILFEELTALKLILARCIIWIFDEHTLSARIWMANSEDKKTAESYYIKKLDHPYYDSIIQGWKERNLKWVYDLEGGTKRSIDLLLLNETELSRLPDAVKKGILASNHTVVSGSFNNFGLIEASGPFAHTEEQLEILSRFGKVFDLGYTRFNDLKHAEAQAREAHIETALEKVRSRTLAMQKSDELAETAAVLFKQLIHLGIAPNRLYIGIVHDESGAIEFWITDEDGSKVSTMFSGDAKKNASMQKMYDGWKTQQKSISIDMQGQELVDYFDYLGEELHVPFKDVVTQKRRLQYIAYLSKGFIGIASPDEQPKETVELLERFASVFNLTFTRFNDLKIAEAHAVQAAQDLIEIKAARKKAEDTLAELQVTQRQLIQSEKMASLGELTAGIAHEIQNPLNFVNNFSEVSNELIAEMVEEVEKGNYEEAKSIAEDVKQNLEKINHHGKRADAIVKGMLQHSRTSSGLKEPTDINTLTDEYLRLAYHGLRARDKTFNSIVKTDFDTSIGKINIISQDIGRVILNLITNAFYTVGEKKKQHASASSPNESGQVAGQRYEPAVSVTTKKVNGNMEIHIADNGNGIPQNIIDKIFQPFFTTKPTGQGTGLGLSLAYDIVKVHDGELRVETKEGEGSEFIIQLPLMEHAKS